MIRKLSSGKYRLYSRKKNPKTGRRRNLGTFGSAARRPKSTRTRCSISSGIKTVIAGIRVVPAKSGPERSSNHVHGFAACGPE